MSAPLAAAPAAILSADRRELARRLAGGAAIDPALLAERDYLGVSLGLPGWAVRLTWKKFAKCFRAGPDRVTGFNLRIEQDDLGLPWRVRLRRGRPHSFGPFAVRCSGGRTVLDYSHGNRGPLRWLRDPLVRLDDAGEVLLGCSRLAVPGGELPTPSYFLLVHAGDQGIAGLPRSHVPS